MICLRCGEKGEAEHLGGADAGIEGIAGYQLPLQHQAHVVQLYSNSNSATIRYSRTPAPSPAPGSCCTTTVYTIQYTATKIEILQYKGTGGYR